MYRVFLVIVGILYFSMGCASISRSDSKLNDNIEKTLVPTQALTSTSTFVVPVTSYPDPLNGTQWELLSFENKESSLKIPENLMFLVWFDDGNLSFRGGCNSIGGHYILENERITMIFAERTEIDCSYLGPNVNEIEEAFSNSMLTFNMFKIEGEQLCIYYKDGEIIFRKSLE